MSCFKKCFIMLFLLFSAGTNLHLLSQEQLPDTVWTLSNRFVWGAPVDAKFSPDGEFVYVSMERGFIFKIKTIDGQIVKEFKPGAKQRSIAITSNGNTLISAGDDDVVHFWNTETGDNFKNYTEFKETFSKDENLWFMEICISKNDKYLALVSNSWEFHNFVLWDLENDVILKDFPLANRYYHPKFSYENKSIYYKTNDNIIAYRDLSNLDEINYFAEADVAELEFSPDGSMLGAACYDGKVRIWDVATKKLIHTFSHPVQDASVTSLAFSKDTKYLFMGGLSIGYKSYIWDIMNEKILHTYDYAGSSFSELAPNSSFIVVEHGYFTVLLNAKWNTTDIIQPEIIPIILFPNPTNNIVNIDFSLNIRELVDINLFDLNGINIINIFNGILDAGNNSIPFNCSQIPQGTYFIKINSASFTKTFKLVKEG